MILWLGYSGCMYDIVDGVQCVCIYDTVDGDQ